MIVTRTPLRVSFCGGGSDIPSFYTKHGGCVISTTINKYVYIAAHKSFYPDKYILKYSESERVGSVDEIKHKYFRECLKEYETGPVELTSMADIPAGTGLGSSSSFSVGLIHALRTFKGLESDKGGLASEACKLEIDTLGGNIGKQDQYAAAYGGMNFYTFHKDGTVSVEEVRIDEKARNTMDSNLMMFYVQGEHNASDIITDMNKNVSSGSPEENQLKMCDIARKLRDELENGDVDALGERLDESWTLKKTLSNKISNPMINKCYDAAKDAGATGGKLLGAGGCGFILLYVPSDDTKEKVKRAMNSEGSVEMPFRFENQGSVVIYNDLLMD